MKRLFLTALLLIVPHCVYAATQTYIPSTSTFHNYTINIGSGTINRIIATTETVTNSTISSGTVRILTSTGALITSLNASSVTVQNLFSASSGTIQTFTSTSALISILNTATTTVQTSFFASTATMNNVVITTLTATSESITESTTTRETVSTLVVNSSFTSKAPLDMATNQIVRLGTATTGGQAVRYEQLKLLQNVFAATAVSSAITGVSAYSNTNVTGSITPISTANKVLVTVSVAARISGTAAGNNCVYGLNRNTTPLNTSGDGFIAQTLQVSGQQVDGVISLVFLDSPATTSSTSYTVTVKNGNASNTCTLNVSGNLQSEILLQEMAP